WSALLPPLWKSSISANVRHCYATPWRLFMPSLPLFLWGGWSDGTAETLSLYFAAHGSRCGSATHKSSAGQRYDFTGCRRFQGNAFCFAAYFYSSGTVG